MHRLQEPDARRIEPPSSGDSRARAISLQVKALEAPALPLPVRRLQILFGCADDSKLNELSFGALPLYQARRDEPTSGLVF